MTSYVIKRLLAMIPTMLGITLITFFMIKLAPGNPVSLKLQAAQGLKSRDFLFTAAVTDPDDGIEEIQIRKLRLSVLGGAKRRITLEADPDGGPSAIYGMLDECLNRNNLPDALFNITLAQFHFRSVRGSIH